MYGPPLSKNSTLSYHRDKVALLRQYSTPQQSNFVPQFCSTAATAVCSVLKKQPLQVVCLAADTQWERKCTCKSFPRPPYRLYLMYCACTSRSCWVGVPILSSNVTRFVPAACSFNPTVLGKFPETLPVYMTCYRSSLALPWDPPDDQPELPPGGIRLATFPFNFTQLSSPQPATEVLKPTHKHEKSQDLQSETIQ